MPGPEAQLNPRRFYLDPDETRGRAMYRARAEAEARLSMVGERKVRLLASAAFLAVSA